MKMLMGVVIAFALSVLSACGSSGDGAFAIRDVEYPDTVVSDGPRGNLTIYWSGNPTFPLTAVFRPTEGGCPTGTACLMPEQNFQEQENPIVFVDSPHCFGLSGRGQVVFDYEVQLTDAEDATTDPYPAPFVCVSE